MIPEPGDANCEINVIETFHLQTDDELSDKELKQIEADDQAIQTILLGLPKDIYAAVDSCETAQEIWLRVQQIMKGSGIGIQEKKAKLFNEWERFTSNKRESIESYYHHFLKLMNDLKRNKYFPEKIATKDLHIADYTQLYDFLKYNQKENYLQQPMPNPEDITDPTTAINMALTLMVIQNAVQNPRVQNVGNQNGLICVQGNGNQNQIENEEYDLMAAVSDLDEIEEVNANFILMANLQQASTSEEQYTELLEPIPESHQVPQNDNDVISEDTSVEQGGEIVEQHPVNFEETRTLYESLYQNLAIEVEKVNSV
nr:hypothetical protein [Tanacetum cinerariifolium]